MTIIVPFDNLERLLNNVEDHASGCYIVDAYIPLGGTRSQVGVVIKFTIAEDEPEFNEAEIRRRLGY